MNKFKNEEKDIKKLCAIADHYVYKKKMEQYSLVHVGKASVRKYFDKIIGKDM